MRELKDVAVRGRRVLIRQDLNAPRRGAEITSTARLDAALTTIRMARDAGAQVLLLSHVGRPAEGAAPTPEYSLAPVAAYLSAALGGRVRLYQDYLNRPPQLQDGEVGLLENVRFNRGEKNNSAALARQYAALCDVFVMDAFGAAHRKQASTYGVMQFAQCSCAGPLLADELRALEKVRADSPRPRLAIIGGAKVSTKLAVLENLAQWADCIIPGGGIANTFLATRYGIRASLAEADLVDTARRIMETSAADIILPEDVVVGKAMRADTPAAPRAVDAVASDEMILDIGARTIARYVELLARARTIIWNGPVGVFELPQFADGTAAIARAIAASPAYSVAGGGDTLAAIESFIRGKKISYVSTGGGAFLEYLEGKTLPAVAALNAAA